MNEWKSKLTLIGYWDGPGADPGWPSVESFVDNSWDNEERETVGEYLTKGFVVWCFMGFSVCRICGCKNGCLELSDGYYIWPDGLAHYVKDHGVRLPSRFVEHVAWRMEQLETVDKDSSWWQSLNDSKS